MWGECERRLPSGTKLLRQKAAIQAIELVVQQKDVERALGLSTGYLSKLKNGGRDPSPDLVAHLATIARNPKKRLHEIEEAWAQREVRHVV